MVSSDILPLSHAKYNDQLLRTGAFSDCIIKSQTRLWHLHRAILSPRCEFFWKCFDGPWEESSAVITMHDDDPDTLERMLRWIYTLEWPQPTGESPTWTSDLMLYLMADKYGLSALMDEARESILRTADAYSSIARKADSELFINHVEDFACMLQYLFDDPPEQEDLLSMRRELLQVIAPMIAKHMRDQTRLQELITTVPAFGIELVEALAKPSDQGHPVTVSVLPSSAHSISDRRRSSQSSVAGSGRGTSPRKQHIPMNEESEDELE